jgi:hypothetical protein
LTFREAQMICRKAIPPAAVAALVLAIAPLAGCGGGSSSSSTASQASFKTSYSDVANQFRQTSVAIGQAIQQAPHETNTQIAAAFRQLATRWQKQVDRLKTLTPPANVAAAYNTVRSAAARVERDLSNIATAARANSASAAEHASASLVTDIQTAKSASTTITNTLK